MLHTNSEEQASYPDWLAVDCNFFHFDLCQGPLDEATAIKLFNKKFW